MKFTTDISLEKLKKYKEKKKSSNEDKNYIDIDKIIESSYTDRCKKDNEEYVSIEDIDRLVHGMDVNEDNQKEESFNIKVPDTEKINKKLSYEDKEVVTKEIEDSLNESNEVVKKEYSFPKMDLLNINSKLKLKNEDKKDLIDNANKLEETLSNFGVEAKVVQVTKGPSVTRFEYIQVQVLKFRK